MELRSLDLSNHKPNDFQITLRLETTHSPFTHTIQLTTQDSEAASSWKPSLTSSLAQLTSSKLTKSLVLAPNPVGHPCLKTLLFPDLPPTLDCEQSEGRDLCL